MSPPAAGSTRSRRHVYPNGGFHMVLLAKNLTGYQNLIKLSSGGFLEGFYHRPRMDKEILRQHSEGLIATSACLMGEVNWHLPARRYRSSGRGGARYYTEIFGEGNFFLEIQNHGLEKEQSGNPEDRRDLPRDRYPAGRHQRLPLPAAAGLARRTTLSLCIQTDKKVDDTDRMRYNSDQIYFKSPDEMMQTFGDFKEALENTIRIAEACNLELELGQLKLPVFPIPRPYVDPDQYLRHLCDEGLQARYTEITEEIKKRLDYELGVIKQMGYAGYFLIVKDFCDYARSQKIPVGPGRGSAAGSIVSYALEDHQCRSDPVQPAVRAVPESGTYLDA